VFEDYLGPSETLFLFKLIDRKRCMTSHGWSGRSDYNGSTSRAPQMPVEVVSYPTVGTIQQNNGA
jgi:hypothetical protein